MSGRPRRALAIVVGAVALAAVAGCASSPTVERSVWAIGPDGRPRLVDPESLPAMRSLREAADRAPATPPGQVPPPPGLGSLLAASDGAPAAHADEPLEALIDRLAAAEPPRLPDVTPPAAPPTDEQHREALARYVEGRQRLLARDAEQAAADLRASIALDPMAAEPWRELGEAHLLMGSPAEAAAAFQQALARGLDDPRVLEQVGRYWLDRDDAETGAVYLAKAVRAGGAATDAALPKIVYTQLARALDELGHTAAAHEALERALTMPERATASSRYQAELAALFRRQADLWREAGDRAMRAGRHDAALEAYERARQRPGLEDEDLTPRLVYAALRAGRPAEAAVHALVGLIAAGRGLSDSDIALLRYAAHHAGLGRGMADVIAQVRAAVPSPAPPTLVAGLARAEAALLPGYEGRRVLREHIRRHGPAEPLVADLLDQHADAAGAAWEAARLVERDPFAAASVAEAALRASIDPDDLLAALGDEPPAALLRAHLLALRGEYDEARRVIDGLHATGDAAAAAAITRAALAVVVGDPPKVDVPPLGAGAPAGQRRETARVLAALERFDEALAALEPLVSSPAGASGPATVGDLVFAADLARRLERHDQAAEWLARALELDRLDDRAYLRLAELHAPSGPRADAGRLAETLRELRQFAPEGRTARLLRAGELLRRGAGGPAADQLQPLLEADPSDGAALELALMAWESLAEAGAEARLARARAWLESQLARRPHAPALVAGWARLLRATGEPERAEAFLRDQLAAQWTPGASAALERLLRETDRQDEADALASERLRRLPPTPERTIERAELAVRSGREGEAVALLRDGLAGSAALSPDQGARMLVLASRLARLVLEEGRQPRRAEAIAMFDLLVERGLRFSPEMHEWRLRLMAGAEDVSTDRLLDAARHAAREYESLGAVPFRLVAQVLAQAGREGQALAFIERAAEPPHTADAEFITDWAALVALAGGPGEARRLIDAASSAGRLAALIARLRPEEAAPEGVDPRAEAAFLLAAHAGEAGRDDASAALYELALRYDPAHTWACNNLGYHLAERGVDLDRAAALLERAHAALPEEASILDSLAWVRYKQGQLRSVPDAAAPGGVREGAVALLARAAATPAGSANATILDHWGDALWADGQRDAAIRAWEAAQESSRRILARSRLSQTAQRHYTALLQSAGAKLRAAVSGRPVAIAPRADGPWPVAAGATDAGDTAEN